jgi:hypothetical protein
MFGMAANHPPHRDDRQSEYQELAEYPRKAEVLAAEPGIGLAHNERAEDAALNGEAPQQLPQCCCLPRGWLALCRTTSNSPWMTMPRTDGVVEGYGAGAGLRLAPRLVASGPPRRLHFGERRTVPVAVLSPAPTILHIAR